MNRQELKWNKVQVMQNPGGAVAGNHTHTPNPNPHDPTTTTASGGGTLAAKEHGLQQILDATNQTIRTTVHTLRGT